MGCTCAINCWRHYICQSLFWFLMILFYGFCFGLLVGAMDEIVHTQQERAILKVGKITAAIIYIVTVIGMVCVKWLRPYQDNLRTALCRPILFIGRCLGCARGELTLEGYDPIESSTAASTMVPSKDSSVAEMSVLTSSNSQESTSGKPYQSTSSSVDLDDNATKQSSSAATEDSEIVVGEVSNTVAQDVCPELAIEDKQETGSPACNLKIEITASSTVEVSTNDGESCQTVSVEASQVVCAPMGEDDPKTE